jgi:hypothetical protein
MWDKTVAQIKGNIDDFHFTLDGELEQVLEVYRALKNILQPPPPPEDDHDDIPF